jgi:hypothetical protein
MTMPSLRLKERSRATPAAHALRHCRR